MLNCSYSRSIWFEILSGLGRPELTPSAMENLQDWWTKITLHWPTKEAPKVRSLVLLAMRSIWLERNNRVFSRGARTEAGLLDAIMAEDERWKIVGFL